MNLISVITEQWLGLCRKPPVLRASQTGFGFLPESLHEGLSEGGAGGSGAIRRGIGAARSGLKTLHHNPQLLWFALLAGLVIAGNILCQGVLMYIAWLTSDNLVRPVTGFFIEFTTLFCMMFLLAGLLLSIPSEKEGPVSFCRGLAGAKRHVNAILLWSIILAFAGMLLDRVFFYPGGFLEPAYSNILSLSTQFPFTLNLNPSTFAEIPGYSGRSLLFWIYPYGFEQALGFSIINLILFILTPFVVPFIVLGHKTLREAVAGSFALMKTIWIEVASCAALLVGIVFGVFLTFVLIQAAHGMFTPPDLRYAIPSSPWIVLGLLYYLVFVSFAFVGATIGGIALQDIYRSAMKVGIPK